MEAPAFGTGMVRETLKEENSHAPMTNQEERELKRVFDLLSNYNLKTKLKIEIANLETWLKNIKSQSEHPETSVANLMPEGKSNLDIIAATSEQRIEELKIELNSLDNLVDNKIYAADILEMHKFLDKKINKNDAEEMIWEIDEDLDGAVNWAEFRVMFGRNVTDETGLETSRLVSYFK